MTHTTTHEPPRFKHDCTACKYLGRYKDVDLYLCTKGKGKPAFMCRSGNDPYDIGRALGIEMIAEAKRRAIEAGYLPAEPSERAAVEATRFDEPGTAWKGHTITIADVAAKLGLCRNVLDGGWNGMAPNGGTLWLYTNGTACIKHITAAGKRGYPLSAREAFALAGYPNEDYPRYEGREPEPEAPKPSQAQVLADLLDAAKVLRGCIQWKDDSVTLAIDEAIAQAEAALGKDVG